MSNSISVLSTVSQAKTFLIEEPEIKLLQDAFFPTSDEDLFVTKEVLFDLDQGDFGVCPMVSKGYKGQNVISYQASSVEPPRCACEMTVDPTQQQRQLFESLYYKMGREGSRSLAFQDLKRIIASRGAERISRKIEVLCASILMNNSIIGTMPTSPTDSTPVPVEIKFYDDTTGNEQRYLPAYAWGNGSATPYDDVCAMVRSLSAHGGRPEILLISPEAYALLASDSKYKNFFETYHTEDNVLYGREYKNARKVARATFLGYPLDIVVYAGGYIDDDSKQFVPFLSKGFVCVLSENVGRTLCGGTVLVNPSAVVEDDLDYNSFVQRRGKFIGSQFCDLRNQQVAIRMESRPLPSPVKRWGWITMDAMNSNSISGGSVGPVVAIDFDSDDDNATLPSDLTNQLGGSKITIADATTSTVGKTFDGYYINNIKQTKDENGKYTVPVIDSVWEARFVDA